MHVDENKDTSASEDYGFSDKVSFESVRLLDADGQFNVERRGVRTKFLYQWLLRMPWRAFFGYVAVYYVLINLLLALGYWAIGLDGIDGIPPGTWYGEFGGAFFFSIQTFTTVGYGSMAPTSIAQQAMASFGALVGLMSVALATGLFFARFSRPRNLIAFSEHAVVAPFRGGRALMFRIANRSPSKLINVRAHVVYSWVSEADGKRARRFEELGLERSHIAMFPMNWTVVHPIDGHSPFADADPEEVVEIGGEVIAQINGYDENHAREVYANRSYVGDQIKWNERFLPMYKPSEDRKKIVLELDLIDSRAGVEDDEIRVEQPIQPFPTVKKVNPDAASSSVPPAS